MSNLDKLIEKLEFVITLWKDPSNEMDGLHTLETLLKDAKQLQKEEHKTYTKEDMDKAKDKAYNKGYGIGWDNARYYPKYPT